MKRELKQVERLQTAKLRFNLVACLTPEALKHNSRGGGRLAGHGIVKQDFAS